MPIICNEPGKHLSATLTLVAALVLALACMAPRLGAQTQPSPSEPAASKSDTDRMQTFFLTNASQANDLNDIQTNLRNMLPKARIYGVQSQNAITLRAAPQDIEAAQKLISELDRPRKLYRLTYTITDADAGKRVGSQHFVLLVVAGQKSIFKQGSRMTIVTGGVGNHAETPAQVSQVQYVDVGLNIEALVTGSPDGLSLRTKIEQSSPSDDKPGIGAQDPLFRQTVLDVSAELTPGKPLVLGSLDLPGTTRHQEIEVLAELIR